MQLVQKSTGKSPKPSKQMQSVPCTNTTKVKLKQESTDNWPSLPQLKTAISNKLRIMELSRHKKSGFIVDFVKID